jgi:hypothetical protein
MHYSPNENVFNSADKQLTNYVKPTSFDNAGWVSEINKII